MAEAPSTREEIERAASIVEAAAKRVRAATGEDARVQLTYAIRDKAKGRVASFFDRGSGAIVIATEVVVEVLRKKGEEGALEFVVKEMLGHLRRRGTEIYSYRAPWKRTTDGEIVEEIVVCLACRKVLEPVRWRQRCGSGEHYYEHEHSMLAVRLVQKKTGSREVVVPRELRDLKEKLEGVWMNFAGVEDMKRLLQDLLRDFAPGER